MKEKTTNKKKRKIIIFSSSESVKLAKSIQTELGKNYIVSIWRNNFFKVSQNYLSNFTDINRNYDYAICICGADDIKESRGKKYIIPRDNVLLELGICIGKLGMENTIMVRHENVKLPSDLEGITVVQYSDYEENDLSAIAGTVAAEIETYLASNLASKKNKTENLFWDEYFTCLKELTDEIKQSPNLGGFKCDVIIGITRGGLMAADLIGREISPNSPIPILPLYAERESQRKTNFSTRAGVVTNSAITNMLKKKRKKYEIFCWWIVLQGRERQ